MTAPKTTSDMHLSTLREYQRVHGHLPPVSFCPKLSRWLQQMRAQARRGLLRPSTRAALLALGVTLDYQTSNAANDESLGILEEMVAMFNAARARPFADDLLTCDSADWASVKGELGSAWRTWWSDLIDTKLRDPGAQRVTIIGMRSPVLHRLLAGDASRVEASVASWSRKPRGLPAILEALQKWTAANGRRPSLISSDEAERYLACWALRIQRPGVIEDWCGAPRSRLLKCPAVSADELAARTSDSALGGPVSRVELRALRSATRTVRRDMLRLQTRWFDRLYQTQLVQVHTP